MNGSSQESEAQPSGRYRIFAKAAEKFLDEINFTPDQYQHVSHILLSKYEEHYSSKEHFDEVALEKARVVKQYFGRLAIKSAVLFSDQKPKIADVNELARSVAIDAAMVSHVTSEDFTQEEVGSEQWEGAPVVEMMPDDVADLKTQLELLFADHYLSSREVVGVLLLAGSDVPKSLSQERAEKLVQDTRQAIRTRLDNWTNVTGRQTTHHLYNLKRLVGYKKDGISSASYQDLVEEQAKRIKGADPEHEVQKSISYALKVLYYPQKSRFDYGETA